MPETIREILMRVRTGTFWTGFIGAIMAAGVFIAFLIMCAPDGMEPF